MRALAHSRTHGLRAREMRRAGTAPDAGPFLRSLGQAGAERLLANAVRRRHEPSDPIATARGSVLVLLHGRAKLIASRGGRTVLVGLRGAGDIAWEPAVCGDPPDATIVAVGGVRSASVRVADVHALCAQDPHVTRVLLRVLAERSQEEVDWRLRSAALDTTGRLAARLVELADRFGVPDRDGLRDGIGLTQEELAGWAGASLKAATTALAGLRRDGLVRTERGAIVVRDLEGLRARSECEPRQEES